MIAGNVTYASLSDLPMDVPVFPLSAALLLPGGQMPLNVFEPRYVAMIEDAIKGDRIIGMIQPRFDVAEDEGANDDNPELCEVGCLGRITGYQETGDGRYSIVLTGVCRFKVLEEVAPKSGYRNFRIGGFANDLQEQPGSVAAVDRDALLTTFRAFLSANDMEADWEGVDNAPTDILVNALSMMSPYGPAEKQALLEAVDLRTRAETLVAITEVALARNDEGAPSTLQ